MNIIKYLLSKSYRRKFQLQYSKELSDKLDMEQKQQQDLYKAAI